MIKTAWYVHPKNTGCLSGKDAGSLITLQDSGRTLYRAPTNRFYDVTSQVVRVPFGEQGAEYIAGPSDVSFLSRKGAAIVHCERVWTTDTDHYVGAMGEAGYGGGLNNTLLTVEHDSINTWNIPDNEAFNTMQITAPMYREPVDLSSTSQPISAPFYKDIEFEPLAPVYKDCCHYGIQTATGVPQRNCMFILGLLTLVIVVLLLCQQQKTN